MKRYIVLAAASLAMLSATAQDTYENARVLGSDLNGTARYVGMGGALEALGADISTMSTNPAGIGMFRHSYASISFGGVNQEEVNKFDNLGKTNLSFDQAGFVLTLNLFDEDAYVNFGFNYHKSRNFDQIIQVNNRFAHAASLNKLAFAKHTFGSDVAGGYSLGYNNYTNKWMGYRNLNENNDYGYPFTQWDYLYHNVYNVDDQNTSAFPTGADHAMLFNDADNYYFDKSHRGWIADYDFNISGNVHNRFFWGFTLGLHDINYKGYSLYDEEIIDANGFSTGTMVLEDERRISGKGVDMKAGIIFLPIEESPFRIGLSISTPTWYEMKSENYTVLHNNTAIPEGFEPWGYDNLSSDDVYEYKYYTPWKFGLSLGHTIGNYLALGASYEYSDYSTADTRIYDGTYDEYDNENSYSDRVMNNHTDRTLKGVSLLKLGAEFKPDPSIAVRLGYNYQSAAYNEKGFRDTTLDSPGTYFSSTPDYVNWKGTNRITAGFGYRVNKVSFDIAYQYSMTKGMFYPFQPDVEFNDNGAWETNISTPSSLNFKRHQLLFTLGYTF
ncbi:OmpP1/FadL family transporter [Xylanibacter brevis]|uniref:OmpP1/FadL family transporter n=1 Tax=Xylanibacter brevis TaxID=83231 RepID=UPI0004862434|nr:hypothetical protein [Xylanibacter brevis]